MTALEIERSLTFPIVHNVRHHGGLPTSSGGRTAGYDIVRSGALAKLTDEGIDALCAQGVRTVVDFRSAKEREQTPSPDLARHGVTFVHAPVFEDDASPVGLEQDFPGFTVIYQRFLEHGAAAYRALFEALADQSGGVLFHCAVGKDRTGVGAALLLSLAGVEDETIAADYAHSEGQLAHLVEGMRRGWRERGIDEARVMSLMAAPVADMEATLGSIRAQWGGAEGYLESIGVSRDAISAVRARMAG